MKDKKIGTVIKTESKVIAYVVICLVIIVLGISYALFFEVKGNEKNQIVKAGTLEFTYEKGSQITNDTNSDCFIPMSEEEALKHSECEYKISITNAGTLPGNYNIKLNSETVDKPLALNKLKVILKKEGQMVDGYPKEGTITSLVTNEKIEAGSVINYSVQIYVDADDELLNADDDAKNISLKINGDAVVNSEDVNPRIPVSVFIKNIKTVESGDGLYIIPHDDLEELGQEWNKTEYRYAGVNPNNYVSFNNEIWRIIGLVNVKTDSGVEQRVKIIRTDGISGQKDFGKYIWDNVEQNNWTVSKLKNMLNGIYYTSGIGECYKDSGVSQCNFNSGTDLPKGLNETARNMIDSEIIWPIVGSNTNNNVTVKMFYERERNIGQSKLEWSKDNDSDYHNGIGLIYASDYAYATNGGSLGRKTCFAKELFSWNLEDGQFQSECGGTDWLRSSGNLWSLTHYSNSSNGAFYISSSGAIWSNVVTVSNNIFPVVYLKTSVNIFNNNLDNYGSIDNPFILNI